MVDAVSALYGSELIDAVEHDDGTGFSIVSGPSSEACAYPCGEGEGAFGVGIFLFFGLAFERGRDGFESGPVFGFEDVPERSSGTAVAVLDHLHAGDAGRKGHRAERREGGGLHGDALDVEAFGLDRAEQLLDHPAGRGTGASARRPHSRLSRPWRASSAETAWSCRTGTGTGHERQNRWNDSASLSCLPLMTVDHHGRGHRLHYHLQNEGQQHPPSGTPGDVLRSRRVWLIERVFPECAGCGAEQASKNFIRRRAVDPIALGQDRGWANSTDKVVDNAPGCSPGSGWPV